mmetsp:Transcript_18530/g.16416  ORF Transcript_18530/g.16416 Transcript_18530/m.16416 type:complete len:83 (+) Transcript_18530:1359-1607(+)
MRLPNGNVLNFGGIDFRDNYSTLEQPTSNSVKTLKKPSSIRRIIRNKNQIRIIQNSSKNLIKSSNQEGLNTIASDPQSFQQN